MEIIDFTKARKKPTLCDIYRSNHKLQTIITSNYGLTALAERMTAATKGTGDVILSGQEKRRVWRIVPIGEECVHGYCAADFEFDAFPHGSTCGKLLMRR